LFTVKKNTSILKKFDEIDKTKPSIDFDELEQWSDEENLELLRSKFITAPLVKEGFFLYIYIFLFFFFFSDFLFFS